MTSIPELGISASPIYETMVTAYGDPLVPTGPPALQPYQPVYQPSFPPAYPAQQSYGYMSSSAQDVLSRFWDGTFGGENMVAIVLVGGSAAEQIRRCFGQAAVTGAPATYAAPVWGQGQAYQTPDAYQAYQWWQAQTQYQAQPPAVEQVWPAPVAALPAAGEDEERRERGENRLTGRLAAAMRELRGR